MRMMRKNENRALSSATTNRVTKVMSVVTGVLNTSTNSWFSNADNMVNVQQGSLKALKELTKSMDRSRRDSQKMRKRLQGRGKQPSGNSTPGTNATGLTYASHNEVKDYLFTKKDGIVVDLLSVTVYAPSKFAENLARELFEPDEIILSICSPQKKTERKVSSPSRKDLMQKSIKARFGEAWVEEASQWFQPDGSR